MGKKVFFKTFGCRTNIFDTQVMMNKLDVEDFNIVQQEKDADIVVINSCTVTNSADSTARNYINSLNTSFLKSQGSYSRAAGSGQKGKGFLKIKRSMHFSGTAKKRR